MHTIIGLLAHDCGISFLYRRAVEAELASGILRKIPLKGFAMQHDFTFIWEKDSIYTAHYQQICQELRGTGPILLHSPKEMTHFVKTEKRTYHGMPWCLHVGR